MVSLAGIATAAALAIAFGTAGSGSARRPGFQVQEGAHAKPEALLAIHDAPDGRTYHRQDLDGAMERLARNQLTRDVGIVSMSRLPGNQGLKLGTTRVEALSPEQTAELTRVAGVRLDLRYGVGPPRGY